MVIFLYLVSFPGSRVESSRTYCFVTLAILSKLAIFSHKAIPLYCTASDGEMAATARLHFMGTAIRML